MKRSGNLLHRIADLDNIYLAYCKASSGSALSEDRILFSKYLQTNICTLRDDIVSCSVEVGRYAFFQIFDPKQRLICAASFNERVLHHAIMNVLGAILEKGLIHDTFACRKGLGIDAALKRAFWAVGHFEYVAKLDFRKYFDSISHCVLNEKLSRIIKDQSVLAILSKIIGSYRSSVGFGLPIGNLTSQYFANFYLSRLDHYAKETLRIPIYLRYMDDILMFSDSLSVLKDAVRCFAQEAQEKEFLQLKPVVYRRCVDGIVFLGYKLFPHKILLARRSKHRLIRNYSFLKSGYNNGKLTERQFSCSLRSVLAFSLRADTKSLREKIFYYSPCN